MSRVWLILLLLVNILFFVLIRWGAALTATPDALLAQAEFNADKIQLRDAAAPPVAADPVAASTPQASAPEPVAVPPASQLSAELTVLPPALLCMTWGEFSGDNLARADAVLATLQLGDKLQRRIVEHVGGYWVYMPPQKNSIQVNRKIEQLKKLGVYDYFVVQEKGEWLHAISLGVFRTEQAADNFLAALKTKGVRTAKVGERQSRLKFTLFELNGIDEATAEKLRQIQQDFPDSELKSADCN